MLKPLGESKFNYRWEDYTIWRFIHYQQQVASVLKLRPQSVLEIGPGDHLVSDFLRRKGIHVETADCDVALQPDYLIDLREPMFANEISRRFDVCLASEVLEHLSFRHFNRVTFTLGGLARYLIISVPYGTVRLLPDRPDYGRFISCEGRIMTRIPNYAYKTLISTLRAFKWLLMFRKYTEILNLFSQKINNYPDSYNDHHWECGEWATRPSVVRRNLKLNFRIHEEIAHIDTNCVIWVLSLKSNKII
jgi:hypothetical protein